MTSQDINLAIANYKMQIQVSAATNNLGLSSIADPVDHRHVNQKLLSLPSLTPQAETFKRSTMSVASLESELEHIHPVQLCTKLTNSASGIHPQLVVVDS